MPRSVIIENPVITSAFEEPQRHFYFDEDGITGEIRPERRKSQYFIPIPAARRKSPQLELGIEAIQEKSRENELVNQIRSRLTLWRQDGYRGATATSRRLLEHWQRPDRDRRLFFCQIEALETLIYLTEVARDGNEHWILDRLKSEAASHNPDLLPALRMALKMATGTGKTVVMSMIVAWQVLNKAANPRLRRYSDAFLVVAPGLTIRDRLRVLNPNDAGNYYQALDLVPIDLRPQLDRAKIVITNYHGFKLKDTADPRMEKAAAFTKRTANPDADAFKETPDQMAARVCRDFGNKRQIIVLNDEAHHCYRPNPDRASQQKYKGDDLTEAKRNSESASLWISGLEAIARKVGIVAIYDLSATPFFLKGSGYPEGDLFPWVVSDFSLIEAIESGIVKIPRVPIDDDRQRGELPIYRHIWPVVREALPKKGRAAKESQQAIEDRAITIPKELEGALRSLYSNYEKSFQAWENDPESIANGQTPPVFIVVCNNTTVSKLVYDFVAGRETGKFTPTGDPILAPGELPLFSNVDSGQGRWSARPKTLLIDSEQLESGEGLSADFRKIAAPEIDEFKAEYRDRFPGSDPDKLTDADLLREAMNTVGKAGKLGEQIRCVVSVSMLTEGWDANTVTHILGVRAFGSQLLCEQVVGRGLRRISYAVEPQTIEWAGQTITFDGFAPEYAEVYGVPFAFIPLAKSGTKPPNVKAAVRVRALDDRAHLAITFPRVLGYRLESSQVELTASLKGRYVLSTGDIPTWVENAPIVGESSIHRLDELKERREQEVAFLLAKLVLERYYRADGSEKRDRPEQHQFEPDVQAWLFPQILGITKQWLERCLECKAGTYPQMLLLTEKAYSASDAIYQAIVRGDPNRFLKPILPPDNVQGSTHGVDFFTTRSTYTTRVDKCHISHMVADTDSWEQKMACFLETECDEVICYVKNQNLGFSIPYTSDGRQRNYIPDFLIRWNDGKSDDPLTLILEVSGNPDPTKRDKTHYAREYWVKAVNQHGGFGRWAFVEVTDPYNVTPERLRNAIAGRPTIAIR